MASPILARIAHLRKEIERELQSVKAIRMAELREKVAVAYPLALETALAKVARGDLPYFLSCLHKDQEFLPSNVTCVTLPSCPVEQKMVIDEVRGRMSSLMCLYNRFNLSGDSDGPGPYFDLGAETIEYLFLMNDDVEWYETTCCYGSDEVDGIDDDDDDDDHKGRKVSYGYLKTDLYLYQRQI